MILCDASPIVALLNVNDPLHVACVRAAQNLPDESLVTSLACFVEAMYFLGKVGGFVAQEKLWQWWNSQNLEVYCPHGAEMLRIRELMARYRDVPMDFADASLVAVAESIGEKRVFTLDSDFYVYRLYDREPFDVIMPLRG